MADTDTVVPETAASEPLKNDGTTSAAPVKDNSVDAAELARLRVEVQEVNLYKNKVAELERKQADDERKQLEESENWKALAEKNAAENKELRDAQDREARQTALKTATDIVLKDYPENVIKLAQTTGLALNDDSEEAKATFKEKLDAIKETVGSGAPISANNPHQPVASEVNRVELVTRGADGVSPMAMAGAKGDDSVARKYVGSLPQIEEMRRMAGLSPKT